MATVTRIATAGLLQLATETAVTVLHTMTGEKCFILQLLLARFEWLKHVFHFNKQNIAS